MGNIDPPTGLSYRVSHRKFLISVIVDNRSRSDYNKLK